MRLLAIDTALDACSVGLADGANPPVLKSRVVGRGHAEALFPMIREAMAEAGLDFADLDRIAVTVGPGSFTGMRVGIAAARGLGLATERPVVGITTLAAIAEGARMEAGERPILAVIDARRGEVYGQAFAADGSPLAEPAVAEPAAFAASLAPGMALAGSGAELVAATLPARPRIVSRAVSPDIAAVVRLGLFAPADAEPPTPLYLRAPDAKPQPAPVARR